MGTLFCRGSLEFPSLRRKSRALLRRKRLLTIDTIEHKAVTTTTTRRRRICLRDDRCLTTTNLSLIRLSSTRVDIRKQRLDTGKQKMGREGVMLKTETGRRNNSR